MLTVVGLADDKAAIAKASGVHINLWTGLGMLIFGILMLVWAFHPAGHRRRGAARRGLTVVLRNILHRQDGYFPARTLALVISHGLGPRWARKPPARGAES